MSVLATIDPTDLQVEAGADTSLVVRVRNRGTIVDQFDIKVVGPTAAWAVVDPSSLRLFPDKEGEARVTFRPPRASEPMADTYPFGIAVRAASDASASTVEEGHIAVAPFVQLTSQIVPQTSRGTFSGTHDITVHNIGNAVAEVTVVASDPDRLLNFEVIPARAGLRAGGDATIRTRVKPKSTFFLGGAKRIPFSVQVSEPTAGSYDIPATIEQHAIIPGWIKPVGALILASVAAVAFLPRILFPPQPSPSPAPVAVVSPTPVITPTPAPITAPPPTEPPPSLPGAPTQEIFVPPDTLVVAGDQAGLSSSLGITFKCPKKDPCRDDVKTRVLQVLTGLGGNAAGAQLVKFTTTVAGTLPVVATWNNRYQYTVNGVPAFAKQVAIDLAPKLSGQPAYAYIKDDNGQQHWYTIPDALADTLLNSLYNLPVAPPPTVDPATAGGGQVFYTQFYDTALYNGLLLQNIQFAATAAP
jgi:hypothetical protein